MRKVKRDLLDIYAEPSAHVNGFVVIYLLYELNRVMPKCKTDYIQMIQYSL